MTTSTFDPANRDLTQAAKYISRAMHDMRQSGQNTWAERLSIAIELLAAPNFREPVLPDVERHVYPKYVRSNFDARQARRCLDH